MSQSNLNFGWIPDMPDMRDYSPSQEEVRGELVKLKGFVSNSKKEFLTVNNKKSDNCWTFFILTLKKYRFRTTNNL